MVRTQVSLDARELELLDRVSRNLGVSRSKLIRLVVRATYGEPSSGEKLEALKATAGGWSDRAQTRAEYVEGLRSGGRP